MDGQWGVVGATKKAIDNLTYGYTKNGTSTDLTNKLYTVDGQAGTNTNVEDFIDNYPSEDVDEYTYDNNGNLTIDKNKRIAVSLTIT